MGAWALLNVKTLETLAEVGLRDIRSESKKVSAFGKLWYNKKYVTDIQN